MSRRSGPHSPPPSADAVESIHRRARRMIDHLGLDAAEWLAEALLVYSQERRRREHHHMDFVTEAGALWRVAVSRNGAASDGQ